MNTIKGAKMAQSSVDSEKNGPFDYESAPLAKNYPEKNTVKSYASAANTDVFPKKDQGIIIECLDESALSEYVIAVGTIVYPKNVIFASKISNKRVGIFLSSKDITAKFLMGYKTITVNKKSVKVEPLEEKNKRVIFSNVSPMIPHEELEKYLCDLNVKCTSKISFIKATITTDDQNSRYAHVLSYRRQVFVQAKDEKIIPEVFKIKYGDMTNTIFVTTDTTKCFLCHEEGHIAKNCKDRSKINERMSRQRNFDILEENEKNK